MIICLTGAAGSGKSTIANILVEDHGFTAVSLADPLREILYKLNPWVLGDMEPEQLASLVDQQGWDATKRADTDVRRYLQDLGQAIRGVNNEFFVLEGEARLEEIAEEAGGNDLMRVVIPDVRFENEARWFRSGAHDYIWRVVGRAEAGVRDDVSEHGIPDRLVDATIHNTAEGVDGLRQVVAELLEHMGEAA